MFDHEASADVFLVDGHAEIDFHPARENVLQGRGERIRPPLWREEHVRTFPHLADHPGAARNERHARGQHLDRRHAAEVMRAYAGPAIAAELPP